MTINKRYTDSKYIKLTAELRSRVAASGEPCWICGRPIDLSLDPRSKWSFTADHLTSLSQGGNLYGELRPAHRYCNSSRGGKQGAENRQQRRAKYIEQHPGRVKKD